jgi:hypothetical protein
MTTLRSARLVALPLVLAACASTDDPPPVLEASPSYVFTVTAGTVSGESARLLGGDGLSGSIGQTFRIDFGEEDGRTRARVTPRWGRTSSYDVTARDGELLLVPTRADDVARLFGRVTFAQSTTELAQLTLDGRLEGGGVRVGGLGAFEGDELLVQGDVLAMGDAAGELAGAVDDEAPELRFDFDTRRGGLLPWSDATAVFAEPVALAAVRERLTGVPEDTMLIEDPSTSRVRLTRAGWWPAGDLRVVVDAGYPDLAGNAGASVTGGGRVFDAAPAERLDLGAESESVVWDGAQRGAPMGLRCEDGTADGCVSVVRRPDEYMRCGEAGGLFVRVRRAAPFRTLRVRARLLLLEGGSLFDGANGLGIEFAAEGSRAVTRSNVGLAPGTNEGAFDSGWRDIDVDLGADVTSVGAALALEGYSYCRDGFPGGLPPSLLPPATLLIESVAAR